MNAIKYGGVAANDRADNQFGQLNGLFFIRSRPTSADAKPMTKTSKLLADEKNI